MKFSGYFETGPVTALATCGDFVIAGVGGNVTVYDSQKRRKLCCQNVLPNQNIHGIRKEFDENDFCIFGEKCFRIIRLITDDKKVGVECRSGVSEVEDWILDVAWLKECERGPSTTLALALSHNVVLHWDLSASCLTHRVCCLENCILYCALLIGSTWSGLVLAAGTVFNQVIIWTPGGDTSSQQQRDIIHTLSGHQGVIFSIDYLPSKQIIASVSDDRTIRLWSLRFPGNGQTVSDWLRVESSPLLTLYGHSARVWDVELLDTVLVSVGEDATCLVWDYTGKIQHKFKGHKGKSIWSLACGKNEKFVVTGGGDCSVRMWTLGEEGGQGDTLQRTLTLPSLGPHEEDYPRIVAMSDFNSVLVMTNSGCLLRYSMVSATWKEISHDPLFSSYTVMAVSPCGKYVAIGNITGMVRVFDVSGCRESREARLYEGKVFGLSWVDSGHLLTTGPNGDMLVISMPNLKTRAKLILPVCKQRWASAGVLCLREGASPRRLCGKEGASPSELYQAKVSETVLVCGDRGGTVHCYNIVSDALEEPCLPVSSFGKIHGKAGVTDVCYHGNRVYTSGRDGRYRQWDITGTGLHLRSTHRVMKGMDWVDRICVSDKDTFIYGFQSSRFTLWSVGENLRLVDVECGGGHRAWDCRLDAGQARFVYLKTKHITVCDTTCTSRQIILKESLHGREMCDVKHLTTFSNNTGELKHLVATCSEDTTVKLSSISSTGLDLMDLKVEHSLQGHLSTVKSLAFSRFLSRAPSSPQASGLEADGNCQPTDLSHQDSHDVIMFSGGGRAQIQVWRIRLKQLCASDVQEDMQSCNNANRRTKSSIPVNSEVCSKDRGSDSKEIDNSMFCDQKAIFQTMANSSQSSGEYSERTESEGDVNCSSNLSHTPNSDINTNDLSLMSDGVNSSKDLTPGPKGVNYSKDLSPGPKGLNYSKDLSSVSDFFCIYEHLGSMFLCGTRTRRGSVHSDPETRVMCLTALCLRDVSRDYSQSLHILAAACSDSYLRIFGFNEDSRILTLLQQSGYHDNCVLKVAHIISGSKVIIISGASEGKIAFWDISQLCLLYSGHVANMQSLKDGTTKNKSTKHFVEIMDSTLENKFEPVAMVTVHQSGLNSIHCFSCGGGRHLVASGGDDNCLSVTTICVQERTDRSCVQVERCVKYMHAHAAQITGVWVLSPDSVVSASIDQRVCVWQVPHSEEQPFKMLGCRYVHISDISNMDVWRDGCDVYLYICGQGLSVIKLDVS